MRTRRTISISNETREIETKKKLKNILGSGLAVARGPRGIDDDDESWEEWA